MTLKYSLPFKSYTDAKSLTGGQLTTLGSLSQYERIYEIVAKIPKDARILDWGCGNGHFSAYLKSLGYTPISYSFDIPEFIDRSSHVLGDTSSPVKIPFDDNSFDYVFSIGVLEHVHESGGSQEASIQEIKRVLRNQGKFIIYHFPNKYSWIESLANFLKFFSLHPHYTHTKKFSKSDIKKLFKEWVVLKSERYAALPRNIFNRLPKSFSNQINIVKMYDLLDRMLSTLIPLISQNHLVIAENKK